MRKWHRWIALPFAVVLLSVAITGVILQFQQFFGEDEAQREKLAGMTSAYSLDTTGTDIAAKFDRARFAAQAKIGSAKLDAVEIQLKGEHPMVTFHVVGASARKLIVNADTGAIERDEPEVRESFILRLHTGEVFGDGGVVLGMFWGTALVVLVVTGAWLYWQIGWVRAKRHGWKKIFWILAFTLLGFSQQSRAGSPFQTDDPGFVPRGWEGNTKGPGIVINHYTTSFDTAAFRGPSRGGIVDSWPNGSTLATLIAKPTSTVQNPPAFPAVPHCRTTPSSSWQQYPDNSFSTDLSKFVTFCQSITSQPKPTPLVAYLYAKKMQQTCLYIEMLPFWDWLSVCGVATKTLVLRSHLLRVIADSPWHKEL